MPDYPKWIWKLFLIVLVVTAVLVYFYVGFNKQMDISSLESGLLKRRIEFSLEKYGDLSDCDIPKKYGVKLNIDDKEPIFVNEISYIKDFCKIKWKGYFCKEFDFKMGEKEVKLDVVFAKG